jgi:hypothetical protein
LPPGPERDWLISFRSNNQCGKKYIHQYFTDEVFAPGDTAPRTVLRKYNKDGSEGRIVVSREQLFDAIDEWHEHSGHPGQERTWNFCRSKYANVTQDHVKFYCQTCFACMKKNPVTQTEKGSQEQIISKVDLTKLRKQYPFGVLMRWIMTLKDHATGLMHICALPRKRPDLIAVVMECYQWLVTKYKKDIYFPVRRQPAKTRLYKDSLEGNNDDDNNEVDMSTGKEGSSASLVEHVSVQRSVALEKKNTKNCGCKWKGVSCHFGCTCNGNCQEQV